MLMSLVLLLISDLYYQYKTCFNYLCHEMVINVIALLHYLCREMLINVFVLIDTLSDSSKY